jgi:N4-gp56 family major capsid protein
MGLQTTGSSGLSAEMKTFYDRVLLERTTPKLLHGKFGTKKRIPRNSGRIIEWRKFDGLANATTPLVEGTLYNDLKELNVTSITGSIDQYGNAVGFSDIVSTVTIDPLLTETTQILAENAAETLDQLCRDALISQGTTVLYANSRVSRATIVAGDVCTVVDLRKIALQMELNRARKIDGFWQAITHPRVIHDIMGTTEWKEAQLYNQTNRIFDGSVGQLYGIKFWVTDVAKVFTDAGDGGTVDVHTMLVFGQNAFGEVELSGHNLETIYKPLGSAGTADPMNQQQTMAWKAMFGLKVLHQAYMLRYECSTSTGSNS